MSFKLSLIVILTLHSLLLTALMSVGQFIANRKSLKNWYFLGLFFVFGLIQTHYILFEMNSLDDYPAIHIFPVVAIFLLGPLIYFITRHTIEKSLKNDPYILFHLLPLLIATPLSVLIILNTKPEVIPIFTGYFYNYPMLVLESAGTLLFYSYLFLSIREYYSNYILSKQTIKNNPSALVVFVILLFFMFAALNDILASLTSKRIFMEISVFSLTSIIIFLFLINFRYPDYYKIIYDVVEKEKRKRSYLRGVNLKKLTTTLKILMEKEEIFMDVNLSLPVLAKQMDVSTHQLSQFLNDKKGESFNSFINKYRIKKAQKLLSENPDQKILSVAFDVGFNSKSTFNAAFTKFTKLTPVEYKRKYLP